ncbi:MAG: hypothetical protein ACRD1Z_05060, partial [Vicinamibacteria bacterium]
MNPLRLWILMAIVVSSGALAGLLAHRKNRDVYGWIVGGVFSGPLAPLALLALRKRRSPNRGLERALLRISAAAAELLARAVRSLLLSRGPYRLLVGATVLTLGAALA